MSNEEHVARTTQARSASIDPTALERYIDDLRKAGPK